MRFLTLGLAALLLTTVPTGSASQHCTDTTATTVGPLHIADGGDWIYLESDVLPGLQRGGDRIVVDDVIGHTGEFAAYSDCNAAEMDILLY